MWHIVCGGAFLCPCTFFFLLAFSVPLPFSRSSFGWRYFKISGYISVAEPQPVEPKLFGDLEPESELKIS